MSKYSSKKLFVFDLDGTLTKSKDYLQDDMCEQLRMLIDRHEVSVISGCGYKQMYEQFLVPFKEKLKCFDFFDIRMMKLSLLPMSGSSMYLWNRHDRIFESKYRDDLSLREKAKILAAFDHAISKLEIKLPKSFGTVEEDRGSQITFSLLGQEAPLAKKAQFDSTFYKRKQIQGVMESFLPEFSVKIGGTTSIDVTRKGVDKAYGIERLMKHAKHKKKDLLFIGDAIFPGGNDWSVKEAGIESISVIHVNETLEFIRSINDK